ncbi:MAG: hypothetical protein JSR18_11695 [Proteobacteria bacterium]|nr:hypothetical protein [Pseudomonadota bacterium]
MAAAEKRPHAHSMLRHVAEAATHHAQRPRRTGLGHALLAVALLAGAAPAWPAPPARPPDAERLQALIRIQNHASRLETVDPASYLLQMEIYVEACQALVENRPHDPPPACHDASGQWLSMADVARFALHDPRRALSYYRRFAHAQGTAASPWAADLLQFDLHDTPAAIAEYRALLTPRPEYGTAGVLLVHASRAQLAWLTRGEVFHGACNPEAVSGFEAVAIFRGLSLEHMQPAAFRQIARLTPPTAEARATLQALPPSLDVLFAVASAGLHRDDDDAVREYMRRVDGAGYLTACYAALHARNAARRPDPAATQPAGVPEASAPASVVAKPAARRNMQGIPAGRAAGSAPPPAQVQVPAGN